MFQRQIVEDVGQLIVQEQANIQAIIGPRQVGKTTAAEQIIQQLKLPYIFETADMPIPPDPEWVELHWKRAQLLSSETQSTVILVLDEIQKVNGWSEVVKRLWDRHNADFKIKLILLGSSALLVQQGLTESLTGRFFLHRVTHWSWEETKKAFGWTLDQWLYFGGYPGAEPFISNESHWKSYIKDSLIETVISKDVFQLKPIRKPTLLRHLFLLSASYPSHVLSYNNMLGQLHDAGNTTTLADYLNILSKAFLVSGLELFSKREIRKKGSSPKLILWNNALINAISLKNFEISKQDYTWWGHVVENAVGAHLLNQLRSIDWTVSYWRDKHKHEVDFVVTHGTRIWAIEVKSGRSSKQSGLHAFKKKYPEAELLLIGDSGIPLEDFFSKPLTHFLQ